MAAKVVAELANRLVWALAGKDTDIILDRASLGNLVIELINYLLGFGREGIGYARLKVHIGVKSLSAVICY